VNSFFDNFLTNLDVIEFIESCLVLEGKNFSYSNNGRDFAKQMMRYAAHVLPHSKTAKPLIVVKGRQVGLSTSTAALSLFYMHSQKFKSFLHAFPEIGQSRKHSSKRLIELIEESIKKGRLPQDFLARGATQSLTQKDFYNGNTLYVEGTSIDGRRLRGTSISGLCMMDEFASMSHDAFRNVLECSANSHFGYIDNGKQLPHLLFGTPESEGSLFQKLWDKSDKRHFFFKCPHCSHEVSLFYNIINRTEVYTNLATNTLVKCLDEEGKGCQKVFDKILEMPKGVWRATVPEKDCDYVGFYVPQFLNGSITRESIDTKRQEYTLRQFYNEVLGKFYSYEEEVLTKNEIIRLTTTTPSTKEWELPAHVLDKHTFMGIDWGARASGVDDVGTGSYTVVTVLSLMPTGQLKLEHASRLSTKDTDEKVKQVTELMKRYNVLKCVADRGFGEAEWQRLQKIHGSDRFIANMWSGNMKRSFVYASELNLITSDKHTVHEMFFDELRQGKFCFPFSIRAEQEIEWLLDHMTNIEVVNVDQNGNVKKQYRKKQGRETDGLASLIYGYTAFQFHKTNGFVNMGNAISAGGSSSGRATGLQPYVVKSSGRGGMFGSTSRPQNYSRSDRRRR
jgi:hypothetical protein